MVRVIITDLEKLNVIEETFTFQYGQIYYYMERKNLIGLCLNLHSNMVRFIIGVQAFDDAVRTRFTFQYGQIYYPFRKFSRGLGSRIYIPIWLDLLCIIIQMVKFIYYDLHSNMVRFII